MTMPTRTAIAYNDRFLEHLTGPGHPERPARLSHLVGHLRETGTWRRAQQLIFDPAPVEAVLAAHTGRHLAFVRDVCRRGGGVLDGGDTHACPESFDIALLAAGAVIAAVDAVMAGIIRNAFCAVRPPGHHAGSDSVMGFCLFNNAAVGARHALNRYRLKRIAIIDWDVHHGNGTQEIFYDERSVFYFSLHQYPFYPGTGAADERGSGDGFEYTMNIPLAAGSGHTEYLDGFRARVLPALDAYRPELIILSAGFDAHRHDPLAGMALNESAFSEMTALVMEAADSLCEGRIVSVLEGGYHLGALARSADAHLRTLMGMAGTDGDARVP